MEMEGMKFQKKQVVVDAYQTKEEMYIQTLEGVMKADPGDWIITGIRGEKYPCKDDIFKETYEPVDWLELLFISDWKLFHLAFSEEIRASMLRTNICSLLSGVLA